MKSSTVVNRNERDANLDFIRLLAILLVVSQHCPMGDRVSGIILGSISYLCVPGAVLFFMVSGALLLDNKLSTSDFLRRRFTKVLWPTLIWTVFYLVVSWVKEPPAIGDAICSILSIPFAPQGTGVLWFMYAIAGLYLVTPILSRWIQNSSNQEICFYVFLWFIAMCLPLLTPILGVKVDTNSPFYYFSGYVGYFVLGYLVVKRFQLLPLRILVPLLLFVVLIPFVLKLLGFAISFDSFSYTSIWCAAYTMLLFMVLRYFKTRTNKILTELSNLSFGVYLVHIFIVRDVLWRIMVHTSISGILSIVVLVLVSVLISYAIVWLISYLPFGDYIIGYKQKKSTK